MLQLQEGITVIGWDGCEPCGELKQRLQDIGFKFHFIDFRRLSPEDETYVRREIIAISDTGRFSAPAVVIVDGDCQTWFTNHGESDVSAMLEAILQFVRQAAE